MTADTPIVIVGAGGHGREILEVLERDPADCVVAGFVDDNPRLRGCEVDGKAVLGDLGWLQSHASEYRIVVAVGDNAARKQVTRSLASCGPRYHRAIARSAEISGRASVEAGAMICAGAIVNTAAQIGAHAIVNLAATVSHDVRVGAFAHLACGAHVAGGASIGEGCMLGTGALVNPFVIVGEWTVVGSGAVVVEDLPAGAVAAGAPARILRMLADMPDHSTGEAM